MFIIIFLDGAALQHKWRSIKKQFEKASPTWAYKTVFSFLDKNPKKDRSTYGNLGIGGRLTTSSENANTNPIPRSGPTATSTFPFSKNPVTSPFLNPSLPQFNHSNDEPNALSPVGSFYTEIPSSNLHQSPRFSSPNLLISNNNNIINITKSPIYASNRCRKYLTYLIY